jgi:hypothetical protein
MWSRPRRYLSLWEVIDKMKRNDELTALYIMITLCNTILKSDYFLLLVWTLTLFFINILLALCFGVSHIRHIQSDTCAWQLFTCCLQDFSAITDLLFCYLWWIFKPFSLFSWWMRCPWYMIWCCVFITLFVIFFKIYCCYRQRISLLFDVWNWIVKQCPCDPCESRNFEYPKQREIVCSLYDATKM